MTVITASRATCDDLISADKCMELIAIHRAISALGYRPGVRSTSLVDCAMSAPQLLIPLVRDRSCFSVGLFLFTKTQF